MVDALDSKSSSFTGVSVRVGPGAPSIARRLPSIAERFGDMNAADLLGAGKIGDGAGDAQHAMEASRREPHRGRGVREQLAPWLIGCRDAVQQFAVGLCIGARTMAIVAVGLDLAGGGNAASDLGAAL